MQRTQTKLPAAKAGSVVLGASALLAICGAQSHADEPSSPPGKPASVPDGKRSSDQPSYYPAYWGGKFWDAQKGHEFWHNTTETEREAPSAESKRGGKPSANGSIRARDRHRSNAKTRR